MTIAGLVVVFFGVFSITDGLTDFLQALFNIGPTQGAVAAQAFEFVGRLSVTAAVVWRLATAIRALPAVNWDVMKRLLRERGVMLALLVGAIMAASMQHRFFWIVNRLVYPEDAYQHTVSTGIQAATNANMIALFSFAMLFVLFYEKEKKLRKPIFVTLAGLAAGISAYWFGALVVA